MSKIPIVSVREPGRVEDYADMLQCVIDGRTAKYLSVPITTGRRFVEWYTREGCHLEADSLTYREQHRQHVIVPNCDAARKVVARLRRERGGVVIEPTAFERPEWDQNQYRYFWG